MVSSPLLKADIALGNISQIGSGNAITANNVITELELIGDGVSAANATHRHTCM
jgi:hypothetical protein